MGTHTLSHTTPRASSTLGSWTLLVCSLSSLPFFPVLNLLCFHLLCFPFILSSLPSLVVAYQSCRVCADSLGGFQSFSDVCGRYFCFCIPLLFSLYLYLYLYLSISPSLFYTIYVFSLYTSLYFTVVFNHHWPETSSSDVWRAKHLNGRSVFLYLMSKERGWKRAGEEEGTKRFIWFE